ncbi:MAG: cupredoxin domain-containing protein [Streptococcaceae bacterium]|jgi:plastocyanin domain-containing protein|nr:cupredoxin domain-containing protein [Streptococcaceae bacterium]
MSLFKNKNEVAIMVDGGYLPREVTIKAGKPATFTFTRVSDAGCVDEIIFNGEKRALPIGVPVSFDFMPEAGEHVWTCGMQMASGKYIAK